MFFFRLLNPMNVFALEKFKEIQLTQIDRDFLESLTTRPLALIICSQTYNGKARFVNDLLNESLLPVSPTVKQDDVIRMIRIKVDFQSLILSIRILTFRIIQQQVQVSMFRVHLNWLVLMLCLNLFLGRLYPMKTYL